MTDQDSHNDVHADRMTTAEAPATRKAVARAFGWHYVQMLVAMSVGMMLLTPVWILAFTRLGWSATLDRPDVYSLTMATSMAIAMSGWMRIRHHAWTSVGEMSAAMYVPFVVFFPLLWGGVMSGETLIILGHVLMLPCMALAMWLRKAEYLPGHH